MSVTAFLLGLVWTGRLRPIPTHRPAQAGLGSLVVYRGEPCRRDGRLGRDADRPAVGSGGCGYADRLAAACSAIFLG